MNTVRDLPANFKLSHGSHKSFEDGMCAMEAVAYIAGEPHSDHPSCASPVLARHCIRLNDRWNDEERQLLLAVIPKLVGTRGDTARHINQMFVLVDASLREIVPIAFEARGHTDLTAQLRGLAPPPPPPPTPPTPPSPTPPQENRSCSPRSQRSNGPSR